MSKVSVSSFKEEVMLNIFDIGIATLIGSEIKASNKNSIETSRFVDLTESFSPSEVKRTVDKTGRVDLKGITFQETDFYLFKTKNSNCWANKSFNRDFIYFDKDAAEHIAKLGPKGIGIDYMSVDAFDAKIPYAHIAFFSNEILVYEGLNLSRVKSGEYYFIGLPLNLKDSEGSAVRAVLMEST